jgi:glycosyltransferase involved in cell wall biosynthesis
MTEAPPTASLFVSTYEMPKHLSLVLAGLLHQSTRDFEVIICDDGSGAETREIIDQFREKSRMTVHHVWQTNEGFRKCRILNEGLRRSHGKICVFLDGDCVPHCHFMRDHICSQEEGRYLAGRRVELGPKISASLTPDEVESGFFDYPRPKLVTSILSGDSEYLNRTVRVPWQPLRKILKMDRVADLKGCNYSVSKAALVELNGFDEEYEGYGREDTDIELRLQNLGFKIKSLKGLALQYHVWHPRREFTPKNDHRLEQLAQSGRVRCERGLVQA